MKKSEFRSVMQDANYNGASVSIKIELNEKNYYFKGGILYSPGYNNGMGVIPCTQASFEAGVSYLWKKAKAAGGYWETKSGEFNKI